MANRQGLKGVVLATFPIELSHQRHLPLSIQYKRISLNYEANPFVHQLSPSIKNVCI